MTLASFRLAPYRLPVEPPFRWRGGEIDEREGVLLGLEDADGRGGWRDAAALPALSADTRGDGTGPLETALPMLIRRAIDPRAAAHHDSTLHDDLEELALSAAARYAVDLALAELSAIELDLPLPQLLNAGAADALPLAALLDGPEES